MLSFTEVQFLKLSTTGRVVMLQLGYRRTIQEARLHAMYERCLELNDSWKLATWGTMFVNRQKRVVMCLVAKAAGIQGGPAKVKPTYNFAGNI